MGEGVADKHEERQHEAGDKRQRGEDAGRIALPPLDVLKGNGAISPGRLVDPGAAAGEPLGSKQEGDEQQHDAGQLGGTAEIGPLRPSGVDAGRQRLHAEVLHGSEIVEAFHQDKRQAGGERRAGHRKGDRAESTHGSAAKGPRHLQGTNGLLNERGSGGEINVGVEDRAEHEDGAWQRTDVRDGKPVVVAVFQPSAARIVVCSGPP